MKRITTILATVTALTLFGCSDTNPIENTISDANQTANLKNVAISTDTTAASPVSFELQLPQMVAGKSFADLNAEFPEVYGNPANYGATFSVNLLADNPSNNAGDAKFDGMSIALGMLSEGAEPINTIAEPFTIAKGTTQKVTPTGTMNLKTHRLAGLYFFNQVAKGDTLITSETGELGYKRGAVQGSLPIVLPNAKIATRADADTKAFLGDAIKSGIFDK